MDSPLGIGTPTSIKASVRQWLAALVGIDRRVPRAMNYCKGRRRADVGPL